MTFIIVRGFQALALLLRYPHPKSLPSGEGTYHRPAGLYARSIASVIMINDVYNSAGGGQALALLLRYPHPKSLPSGEGTYYRPDGLYARCFASAVMCETI